MARPYSENLRERVLKVVDEKKTTMEEISKMFKIDRKTPLLVEEKERRNRERKAIFRLSKGS